MRYVFYILLTYKLIHNIGHGAEFQSFDMYAPVSATACASFIFGICQVFLVVATCRRRLLIFPTSSAVMVIQSLLWTFWKARSGSPGRCCCGGSMLLLWLCWTQQWHKNNILYIYLGVSISLFCSAFDNRQNLYVFWSFVIKFLWISYAMQQCRK